LLNEHAGWPPLHLGQAASASRTPPLHTPPHTHTNSCSSLPRPLPLATQVLQHYGRSLEHGHRHILQSLPRLLTLYFDYGTEVVARKSQSSKERSAYTQVGLRSPLQGWLLAADPSTFAALLLLPLPCHPGT
jgi:hypothetical protein